MNKLQSEEPLQSLRDIFVFQKWHYLNWGGRTVAHTILQLLFLMGRPSSAVCNALGCMILCYLIAKLASDKVTIYMYAGIQGFIYFLNPASKEIFLWYTGIANYMWTALLILLAAYPYLQLFENPDHRINPVYGISLCPIAFLAGWTNENMAPTLILVMIAAMFYSYRTNGKADRHLMLPILTACIGCAFLVFAPGNHVRAETIPKGIMSILYRGHGQVNAWLNWLLLPNIILILSYYLLYTNGLKFKRKSIALTGWAVLSILVMVLSPNYPCRATFGSFVLICSSIFCNIDQYVECQKKHTAFFKGITGLLWLGLMGTMISVALLAFVRGRGVYIPG